jgi:hypothetical protein
MNIPSSLLNSSKALFCDAAVVDVCGAVVGDVVDLVGHLEMAEFPQISDLNVRRCADMMPARPVTSG